MSLTEDENSIHLVYEMKKESDTPDNQATDKPGDGSKWS